MRRLELLKYDETIMKVLDALIYKIKNLIEKCEDRITKMAFKHVLNKLEEEKRSIWFSLICKKTLKEHKIGITDLDKIIVVDGMMKALIEYKHRKQDFEKAIMLNAFQFYTIRDLSIKSNIPFYYIIEIGDSTTRRFRILKVDKNLRYELKKLGNGNSRDTYIVTSLDNSILLDEFGFKKWLREVLG